MRFTIHRALMLAAALSSAVSAGIASADTLSKEECIDAHSRGQDARDQGKLSLARKLFLTCAQTACPALVQGDCARFADDLSRQQPTVSFAARDGGGDDLPDTTVYVDDVLVVTRLDGKPHDVDPGTHVVKFANAGREQVVTVVIGSGEKGRTVAGVFAASEATGVTASTGALAPRREPGAPRATATVVRPTGAKLLIGLGATAAVGGVALGVFGMTRVPSNCSISTHECAAPQGDGSFDKAASGVQLMNIGFAIGAVGTAAAIGGIVWYVKGGKTSKERAVVAAPFFTSGGGGLAVRGSL